MAETVEEAKNGTRRGTRTRRTLILSQMRVPFRQPGGKSNLKIIEGFSLKQNGSGSWIRTSDQVVNSHLLYR